MQSSFYLVMLTKHSMNQQPFLTLAVCWFTRAKDNKLVVHKEVWLQIMMVNPVFLKAN